MALRQIYDLILRAEAGARGYNAVWSAIRPADRPAKEVTKMTVAEVMAWQGEVLRKGYASSAVGGFQFISKTLRGLVAQSRTVSPSHMFSRETQEALAYDLLAQAGLQAFLSGRMDTDDFARALARIWAGLPDPSTGRSVYAGDGLNAATVSVAEVRHALDAAKELADKPPPAAPKIDLPPSAIGVLALTLAALAVIRGRKGLVGLLILAAIGAAIYFGAMP